MAYNDLATGPQLFPVPVVNFLRMQPFSLTTIRLLFSSKTLMLPKPLTREASLRYTSTTSPILKVEDKMKPEGVPEPVKGVLVPITIVTGLPDGDIVVGASTPSFPSDNETISKESSYSISVILPAIATVVIETSLVRKNRSPEL